MRRKWNLIRYCTSIVSLKFSRYGTDEPIQHSFKEKVSKALNNHQVKIQLVTIYAGLFGIVLEGYFSTILCRTLVLFLILPSTGNFLEIDSPISFYHIQTLRGQISIKTFNLEYWTK